LFGRREGKADEKLMVNKDFFHSRDQKLKRLTSREEIAPSVIAHQHGPWRVTKLRENAHTNECRSCEMNETYLKF